MKIFFHPVSPAFLGKLKEYGMVCPMPPREASRMWSCHSRKGNCRENGVSVKANAGRALCRNYNAPTESWFGGPKNKGVHGERFGTRDEVIAVTFEYIEVFYNRKRAHSTPGYKSPMQFLEDRLTARQYEKLAA
ncbi:MAG: hypothetical protein EPO42_12795 [Gallionellaceae bacterium]|nr:MAG: hypothetical protein EPO42_12795 [Gallionellaceae bacterium]